ncbi:hypothetical protein [Malikia sp.]|uniref:hypothetical protein n=1 Tax=Malikia sp. TaxID=2070706 RepID=UPI002621B5A4|nr:hypothetical protein [Malikia sp.]MDD2730407.1 hypothetical protein [Malikia sp.]
MPVASDQSAQMPVEADRLEQLGEQLAGGQQRLDHLADRLGAGLDQALGPFGPAEHRLEHQEQQHQQHHAAERGVEEDGASSGATRRGAAAPGPGRPGMGLRVVLFNLGGFGVEPLRPGGRNRPVCRRIGAWHRDAGGLDLSAAARHPRRHQWR